MATKSGSASGADIREFIAAVEAADDLIRISEPVSTRLEAAAILEWADRTSGKAVLFEQVKGYRVPVLGNLLSSRRRLALAFGVAEDSLLAEYSKRMAHRVRPKTISHGPVTETFLGRNVNILRSLPVLTHREKDAGPYFTSAVTLAKDPDTGATGMGIYRIQVRGPDEVSLNFQNPPLSDFLRKAEASRRELEIAIVVGMDPLTFLGSVSPAAPGVGRFEIAGGLRGSAVELVRCRTVDVLVPANAEFVLEGRVKPGVRVQEGPFGESWGTRQEGRNPVAKIGAILSRKAPVYHALMTFSGEETTLLGIIAEASALQSLRARHSGVISVALDRFDRSRLIVQMKKTGDKEPARVLEHLLSNLPIVKTAVVVDEDIDPHDPYAVGFAIATRFRPKTGALILDRCRSSSLDPSARAGKEGRYGSKLGMDATRPLSAPKGRFEMVEVSPRTKDRSRALRKLQRR